MNQQNQKEYINIVKIVEQSHIDILHMSTFCYFISYIQ